jgi:hypothetical protein
MDSVTVAMLGDVNVQDTAFVVHWNVSTICGGEWVSVGAAEIALSRLTHSLPGTVLTL